MLFFFSPMFIAAQFTIAKCWKQPKCPSVNEWIKKLLHLHYGILHSRKKEGTPTLHNSMNGTGEHYAKWSKPGGERQILYGLTYKWNLINKTKKWAKYNQRHGKKEQTDSNQRDGWREIMEKEREGSSRNMCKGPMDKGNGSGAGLNVGGGGG